MAIAGAAQPQSEIPRGNRLALGDDDVAAAAGRDRSSISGGSW